MAHATAESPGWGRESGPASWSEGSPRRGPKAPGGAPEPSDVADPLSRPQPGRPTADAGHVATTANTLTDIMAAMKISTGMFHVKHTNKGPSVLSRMVRQGFNTETAPVDQRQLVPRGT